MYGLKALGLLIAGTINGHIEFAANDPDMDGCCSTCCGPSAALMFYRDADIRWDGNESVGLADRAAHEISPDGGYTWQLPNGFIDWQQLDNIWDRYECPDADAHAEMREAS